MIAASLGWYCSTGPIEALRLIACGYRRMITVPYLISEMFMEAISGTKVNPVTKYLDLLTAPP